MMDMEYVGNDYSVLLDDPEPEQQELNQMKDGANGPSCREPESRKPWWSLEFYQKFFDVTTEDVISRLNASMMPLRSDHLQSNALQENPDLYGPFWICATLAIETGLSSYAAYYAQNHGLRSWRQTVGTVYQAAVLLFLYCWCLPTMLWIGQEWNPMSTHKFRLPELWCVFGYATAILVPAAGIWAAPVIWFRWLIALGALSLSGVYICGHLRRALCQLQRSSYYSLLVLFFVLNYLVGCSLVVLFFPSDFGATVDAQIVNSSSSAVSADQALVSKVDLKTGKMEAHNHNITSNTYNSSAHFFNNSDISASDFWK